MKELPAIVDPPRETPARASATAPARASASAPAQAPALTPAETAFAAELARLQPAVAALLRRVVAATDLRHDALQEALARAWRHRASYDPARPLGPWLATIALRVAKEQERGRRRRPERDGASVPDAELPVGGDPRELLERREELARLGSAVAELPPLQRQIVERFYCHGAALAVIAEELLMPLNTVKSHLRRARLALAERLGGIGEEV